MIDLAIVLRVLAGLAGVSLVILFFKSIIRVGILNQHYQDPIAAFTGRSIFYLFRFRIRQLPGGQERKNEIMTWYLPCVLIGIVTAWFLLVMLAFALLNLAFAAERTFIAAFVASGSALSTLGFSTPSTTAGQIIAICEGAIGLFLVVYLFTFLPGFMDLIRERGSRVAWIYHRAGPNPSGVSLLLWMARNGRLGDFPALSEDWGKFFHVLASSRSFLPILCIIRPLTPENSWICAFAAFVDAQALMTTTVASASGDSRICFDNGVSAIRNTHFAMRGTPVSPLRDPALMRVKRAEYDIACAQLEAAGIPLVADRETAWKNFVAAHMAYEEEVAWLAAAISDPLPAWPSASEMEAA